MSGRFGRLRGRAASAALARFLEMNLIEIEMYG
jgi:hypothetical protein